MTLGELPTPLGFGMSEPKKMNGWLLGIAAIASLTLFLWMEGAPYWAIAFGLLTLGFCVGRADSERAMNSQYLKSLGEMASAKQNEKLATYRIKLLEVERARIEAEARELGPVIDWSEVAVLQGKISELNSTEKQQEEE